MSEHTNDDAMRNAEILARVTGSVGATVRYETRLPDGSLVTDAEATWRRAPAYAVGADSVSRVFVVTYAAEFAEDTPTVHLWTARQIGDAYRASRTYDYALPAYVATIGADGLPTVCTVATVTGEFDGEDYALVTGVISADGVTVDSFAYRLDGRV